MPDPFRSVPAQRSRARGRDAGSRNDNSLPGGPCLVDRRPPRLEPLGHGRGMFAVTFSFGVKRRSSMRLFRRASGTCRRAPLFRPGRPLYFWPMTARKAESSDFNS